MKYALSFGFPFVVHIFMFTSLGLLVIHVFSMCGCVGWNTVQSHLDHNRKNEWHKEQTAINKATD